MRLRYTKPALADLKDIAGYLDPRSPQGARRVRQRIKLLIEKLPEQPFVGKRTEDLTIRRLTAVPYPYLIFYEVTEAEIIIHAVRHGARAPASMPGQ
ncbi:MULTISPECIES: type II toxin-antitoxin system RelE/ParE family toxin [unclassified Rhizobium]|uniref:type II toxin-antitoxin system RelE/ParE family toxin n=1 Tax=unclassified Rhizobium TaxID=2613769 RepID=UPI001C8282FD|nr:MULTISPECIES: type II toxin-antitoxin system RelE/ParE family toxin [unclassified Rhizobium]MBX5155923.1 type II toxin-antitoxin system RelE/ParE family toxin [Rhizobium sp. NZLR8]MBX5164253.1 type II toxin-antitoxin system RelE/ParE family toxin [Rhizobium sp. NZLR4b]MBX5195932.1 type II toxin-antitoxin system RelE/ParE family toxin [Rhizobium sp. NZLR10]MBX5208243.1 type II toxin-antitoxin system RelE/ParE family toxin [Rhizobium sp. NZLR11]